MAPLILVITWHFGTGTLTRTSIPFKRRVGKDNRIFLPPTLTSTLDEGILDSSTVSTPADLQILSIPSSLKALDVLKIGRSDSPSKTLFALSFSMGNSAVRNCGDVTTPGLNLGHVKFGLTNTTESLLTVRVQSIQFRASRIFGWSGSFPTLSIEALSGNCPEP